MTGSFSAVGASKAVIVPAGGSLAYSLTVGDGDAFIGTVALQRRIKGETWETVRNRADVLQAFTGTADVELEGAVVADTLVNEERVDQQYRVSCSVYDGASDAIGYALTARAATVDLVADSVTVGDLAVTGTLAAPGLPDADPEVANQVYADSNVLTRSEGA